MNQTALFVRIPTAAAEKLDRAAFELKVPKQQLVASLVSSYVDPSTAAGLDRLRTIGRISFDAGETSDVLTTEQAARYLQVEESALLELAERGELPGRKLGGEWRFSRGALLGWLGQPGS